MRINSILEKCKLLQKLIITVYYIGNRSGECIAVLFYIGHMNWAVVLQARNRHWIIHILKWRKWHVNLSNDRSELWIRDKKATSTLKQYYLYMKIRVRTSKGCIINVSIPPLTLSRSDHPSLAIFTFIDKLF